jgi:hypothetical protein
MLGLRRLQFTKLLLGDAAAWPLPTMRRYFFQDHVGMGRMRSIPRLIMGLIVLHG